MEYPGSVGNTRELLMIACLSGQTYLSWGFFWWGDLIRVMLRDAKLDYACRRTGNIERGLEQRPACVKTGGSRLHAGNRSEGFTVLCVGRLSLFALANSFNFREFVKCKNVVTC